MFKKQVQRLTIGDTLGEDIYNQNEIIIKKGTVLNLNQILLIQLLGYHEVNVYEAPEVDKFKTVPVFSSIEYELRRAQFQKFLSLHNENERYITLIINKNDYRDLVDLFTDILSQPETECILSALNTWDPYSYEHSLDAFIIGTLWLKQFQIKNIEEIATGFLLHDIGKIYTPREILQKPGCLNCKEYQNVQMHTTAGYELLKEWHFSNRICKIALLHHLGMDGSGYPIQNKMDEIPFEVRLMSIVDVFSALTLERPHRKAYNLYEAIKIIQSEQKKFGADLLDEFIDRLEFIVKRKRLKH